VREFVVKHPVENGLVVIKQGVQGFFDAPGMTDILAESINKKNGNTERDLEIAVTCSMFGWGIPAASVLSR